MNNYQLHDSLRQEIQTDIEVRREFEHPLIAALSLNYSPSSSPDLSLHFNVSRILEEGHQRFHSQLLAHHPKSEWVFVFNT